METEKGKAALTYCVGVLAAEAVNELQLLQVFSKALPLFLQHTAVLCRLFSNT